MNVLKLTRHIAIIIAVLYFSACDSINATKGNGVIISQSRVLNPYTKVQIQDNYQVMLEKSNREEVIIETDENLIGLINTNIQGDQLVIENQENIKGSEPVKITILYKQLERLEITGASLVNNNDVIKSDELDIELSGAGLIDLEIEAKNLSVALSGAGLLTLKGYSNSQSLDLSGAGNVDASDLITQKCDVKLTGFGSALVHATELLKANVNGAGVVKYYGNPAKVDTKIGGLGNVVPAQQEKNQQEQI